jgi:hypothetical protein
MSGSTSKRAQARNERALQDLIKGVPGNSVCADCQARNPGEKGIAGMIAIVLMDFNRMG